MPIEVIGEAEQQEPTVYEKGGCIVSTDELIVQALNDIVVELRSIRMSIEDISNEGVLVQKKV